MTVSWAELDAHGVAKHTLLVKTPQGERWHELSARHCKDAVTGQSAILVSETDISTVKHTEERAQYQALHDALTGLPNRSYVLKRFQQLQAHMESTAHQAISPTAEQAALIFIDLDHFKDVNDTLGHAVGDALLVQVAQRLRQVTRGTDLVARLGGDEFLIFLTSADLDGELAQIQTRLLHSVAQPLFLGGTEVRVTPSAGVALYPRDGSDIQTLMRNADLAMYAAKESGRNAFAFYQPAMSAALHSRTEMEAELRQAVERNAFTVYFQPRVDVATGQITGAEALVRWQHPVRGLLPPDVFIATCERTGLIRPIGNFVLQQAAAQQARWAHAGYDLLVSVNLSAYQLMHPALLADIAAALAPAQGQAQGLELEITESMLLDNDPQLAERLAALQRMGFLIALDDFGTGYSNLAYLQRFPITTLKIDKTFIQCDPSDRQLTSVITTMCKLMGYTAVAEGVETPEQLAWVQAQGIAQYQGYLYAPAVSVRAFEALLATNNLMQNRPPAQSP
ncbi:MAG: EAL domain-containing protein [Rhodoferax sp.]|uniref:putative bifunctional diguanylate cyclase/phosphodiesterase n=1 Tax=Rhodoferax sp. TaxID=50421 RepID=UPI0032668CF9